MWNQPYLETCCRSALHRLSLAGDVGRPSGLKDGGCLQRLVRDGFARLGEDGRLVMTDEGRARHATEILGAPKKMFFFEKKNQKTFDRCRGAFFSTYLKK